MPDFQQLMSFNQQMLQQQQDMLRNLAFAGFVVGGIVFAAQVWVLYLFYRCFRDHADEMQKIRLVLEFRNARESKGRIDYQSPPPDAKYMPPVSVR